MRLSRKEARKKRKQRIKKTIHGDAFKPRLVVFRSNKYIYAQVINDVTGQTLASSSSLQLTETKGLTKEVSAQVGQELAKKSLAQDIDHVVFDRNGYTYHGRIKALADGARQSGLKF
jgi:large subunit ribosomal protein L18